MKRVLHVTYKMDRGGIETFIMNLYRKVDKTKIQFDFVVYVQEDGDYDEEIKSLGGNIYHMVSRKKNWLKNRKQWNELLTNHTFDTIHMHVSSLTEIYPLKVAKKYFIKNRYIHAHNTYQKGIIHAIFSRGNKCFISSYATKLLACSTEAGHYVFGQKAKFELINNGIECDKFIFNEEVRKKERDKLGITNNEIVIGHIGRFCNQKNQNFMIQIMKELVPSNPNYKLILVGDGSTKSCIQQIVKEKSLDPNVIILDNMPNVYIMYQVFDIFILPSLHEGLPVVLIEAQVNGLPCLVSDTVSKEAKLIDSTCFLNIDSSIDWAKKIKETKTQRNSDIRSIIDSEYNMDNLVNKLTKYYLL